MVTTRRNAAAPAGSSQDTATTERGTDAVMRTPEQRARPRRAGRKVAVVQSAQVEIETQRTTTATSLPASSSSTTTSATTTTTTRRLRSKPTASPLKSLDETKRNIQKPIASKATPHKESAVKNKRKRNALQYANTSASATPERETPEPESAQDGSNDDQGIFFTQSRTHISSTPSTNTLIASVNGRANGVYLISPNLFSSTFPQPPALSELDVLRRENFQLSTRITDLEQTNLNLVRQNGLLLEHIDTLQTAQVKANRQQSDIDSFGIPADGPSTAQPEFIRGDESALALLHRIESAAREPRTAEPDNESETEMMSSPQKSPQQITRSESSHGTVNATPSRPISTPSSFFSRSFSALKSKLGFTTSTPSAPSSTAPSSTRAPPPPDSITEALSAPPTPVGERTKARPKKKKQSPMLRLLTKGVEPSDIAKAEEWAKHVIPTLKNDPAFASKRTRLESPVLIQDLNNFPSSKPWETGFGDPLGEMDDEEVAPVWAVYLDMLVEAEEPQHKKHKSSHESTMDVEDTLSMNEMFPNSSPTPPRLHDSQGHSASLKDFHPRRSIEPSPMFGASVSHQQGHNIFGELKEREVTAQLQADDRETLLEATKKIVPAHNPAQGSFGLDYDSDEEDSTMISEVSDTDAGTAPLWTQPPPPAPVPAHAPLPGGPVAETTSGSSSQQPVDEIERQRQKLMKHTPAKPSRLREAFVPSPSLMSDAGNESIFLATPLPATGLFEDMPDAEDLGLTDEDWAAVEALRNSTEWKAADAANVWPDAILTYESDEDALSPA